MKPLLIGCGNRWRSDDGIGPRVVEAIETARLHLDDRGRGDPDFDLVVLDGEPARLMEAWEGRAHVVLVDAIKVGAVPGTVHCVDALHTCMPSADAPGTHGAGVASAVALARSLGRLPERMTIIGVEPGSLDHGTELSAPVAAAFADVVRRALEEATAPCA